MTVRDTPELLEKGRQQFYRKDIDRLLTNYKEKIKEKDYAGAKKIEFILAKKYNIEGDTRYDASENNGDLTG
jgi:hypothetical protein